MSIRIENLVTPSPEQWERIIVGMRHPMQSYDRSDTTFYDYEDGEYHDICGNSGPSNMPEHIKMIIGSNDFELMMKLRKAGTEHRKFMRMITVYVDVTAPLYWWKEFDTYKVGTVTNSCSTMHKIHAKEFTLDDFSCEHLDDEIGCYEVTTGDSVMDYDLTSEDILKVTISVLNFWRNKYLTACKTESETGLSAKEIWWQMIQLLPSSYNQKRTVMLNYEVLTSMYHQRKTHRLDEWREFCSWIETLPYSELIIGSKKED